MNMTCSCNLFEKEHLHALQALVVDARVLLQVLVRPLVLAEHEWATVDVHVRLLPHVVPHRPHLPHVLGFPPGSRSSRMCRSRAGSGPSSLCIGAQHSRMGFSAQPHCSTSENGADLHPKTLASILYMCMLWSLLKFGNTIVHMRLLRSRLIR